MSSKGQKFTKKACIAKKKMTKTTRFCRSFHGIPTIVPDLARLFSPAIIVPRLFQAEVIWQNIVLFILVKNLLSAIFVNTSPLNIAIWNDIFRVYIKLTLEVSIWFKSIISDKIYIPYSRDNKRPFENKHGSKIFENKHA